MAPMSLGASPFTALKTIDYVLSPVSCKHVNDIRRGMIVRQEEAHAWREVPSIQMVH